MSPEVEYLRARYDEEEAYALASIAGELDKLPTIQCHCGRRIHLGARGPALADLAAKRKILDQHEQWPVYVERPPVLDVAPNREDWVVHVTQSIDWVSTQQYRYRFGAEPPTSPIIRALLQPYADREDFPPMWREI